MPKPGPKDKTLALLQEGVEKRISEAHKGHPGFEMWPLSTGGVWWVCSCEASEGKRKEERV